MRGGDRIWKRRDRHNQWWLKWWDGNKWRKRKSRRQSYSGAKSELARLELGLEKVPEGKPIKFSEYAKRWMASHVRPNLKPSTVESYEGILNVHLLPRFGKLPLEQITRKAIKIYLDELVSEKRQARNTVRNIVATLRSILAHAVEDEVLSSNPAVKLGRFNPKGEGRKAEFLTQEEAESFLQTAKSLRPNRYPLFLTALRTGMRLGELLALEWDDIQFGESEEDVQRYILVRHNFTHGTFTSPKNKKERRVDLNKELRQVLIELRDQRMLEAMQRGEEGEVSGLVFPSEAGGPLDSRNVYHRDFLPCLKAAGLRRVSWHCCRHSFGSMLIAGGASLAYVKEQMGHSSIQVTVDIYGHLVPGGNIRWIDRLASAPEMEPEVEPHAAIAKRRSAK